MKHTKCKLCNCDVLVNKRSRTHNILCNKCNSFRKKQKKCKVCGASHTIINGVFVNGCIRIDICRKHRLISSLIDSYGFDKSVLGTEKVYDEYDRIKNVFNTYYNYDMLSTVDIAKIYNKKSISSINKMLHSLGICVRNNSNAQYNAILNSKSHNIIHNVNNYGFNCGWHTTWDGKQIYYRSSYELEFAKFLDTKNICYEVEALRIQYFDTQQNKIRIAIPDFYLPDSNTIVEIKSSYTYDCINMKDRIASYIQNGYCAKYYIDKNWIDKK